jgi:glycosyltransferase involved in cell wall biosynthesis
VIPNGALLVEAERSVKHIEAFGLQPGRYFLQVSRFVPEKRQLDLIDSFVQARLNDWKLVLVGGLDATGYSAHVRSAAATARGVVLTGFLTGAALREIYSHARAFVLPSSHEGLPIAILEALSYGLPVVASAIPANLEIGLPASCYFPVGDIGALSSRLKTLALAQDSESERAARRAFVSSAYDWDRVAGQTLAVYRRVMAL